MMIPIRLPLLMLRICTSAPFELMTVDTFRQKWTDFASNETRQTFNIDFSACRSLSQLKETLRMNRAAF